MTMNFFAFQWPLFCREQLRSFQLQPIEENLANVAKFLLFAINKEASNDACVCFPYLHIYFQMIVFVFPMFAESDEKTPQACCDEHHAWCQDVVSTWPA